MALWALLVIEAAIQPKITSRKWLKRPHPYALISVNDIVVVRSRTIENTLNPRWDQDFDMYGSLEMLIASLHSDVIVKVMSIRPLSFLFNCTVTWRVILDMN